MSKDEVAIATLPRNEREELRITIGTYKGLTRLHLRVWYKAAEGDMRPGSAGFTVRMDQLEAFKAAIDDAHVHAVRERLVP